MLFCGSFGVRARPRAAFGKPDFSNDQDGK